jgi:tRNA 2-thiouridine synthesizing protein C
VNARFLYVQKHFLGIEQIKESLEMALAAASLDLHVSLLFMDDGVFQLIKSTEETLLSAFLKALPFYGVDTIYVVQESMFERGLDASKLVLPVTCLLRNRVRALLDQYDRVLS